MDSLAMGNANLNFKYNTCRIDLLVAGDRSEASGFVYVTAPMCDYNYVFTAKHAFQEGELCPDVERIENLKIRYRSDKDNYSYLMLYRNDMKKDFLYLDDADFAILRIKKQPMYRAKRVVVKNATEIENGCKMQSHSFLKIKRTESTILNYVLKDGEDGIVTVDGVRIIENYEGTSGSGICCKDEPFLINVVGGWRLPNFEQDEIQLPIIDWDEINKKLHLNGWSMLNRGGAELTAISDDKEVIDIRELSVNGAILNMEDAIARLKHDIVDDWYFDPLHFVDMCNVNYVMEFFSKGEHRTKYEPDRMEVFYLPKKTFVLRKAMVGTFLDRLVYMAVVDKLGPVIENNLSKNVYSARYNIGHEGEGLIVQGVEQWTKMNYQILNWIENETTGCLVKLDLLNYYDTINKDTLIRLLNEIVSSDNDKSCVKLLATLLKGMASPEEHHGIPQNNDASSLLATFYVSHVDNIIQSKALHYCRFIDDMYFVSKDIYEARNLLQAIEKYLRQIGLSLNAQKVDFIRLDNKAKKEEFMNSLALYDHDKSRVKYLVRSDLKGKRMNGIKLLMDQLTSAFDDSDKIDESTKDRALKFSSNALSSYRLNLYSYWDEFYSSLLSLTIGQSDEPTHTPLICRLISSVSRSRDMEGVYDALKMLVLRKTGSIYEWQAYHLWMLLAYLKIDDSELVRYASDEIEKNDETKRVEVAAIMIYMVTVRPKYARNILHRLREGQIHANFQKRCALIAIRGLDNSVIDEEIMSKLSDSQKISHEYLNRHKDKPLVFFHHISSYPLRRNESSIFPELYSGL